MPKEHPKSEGAIFINRDRQTDKQPNWRGHIEITKEQIMRLVEMGKAGMEVKLQVAAWNRQAKQTGQKYLYLQAEAYMKEAAEEKNSWNDAPSGGQGHEFIDDDIPF